MEDITLGGFSDYRQLTAEVRDDLTHLKKLSGDFHMEPMAVSIQEILDRSIGDSFDIAVIGEFKRGKSTLINALLGKEILPSDAMPATAVINRVTYDLRPYAVVDYRDGRQEEVAIDDLADYVTKLTEESEQTAATVRQATVHYPISYCKNNVDIIDTPGLNDDSTMAEVTLSVLPQIDAALFVIMAQSPFSEYERDFLENKLLTSDMGRVMFVVTGIDRLDPSDAQRVLVNIRERIDRYVMDRAKAVLGEDSPQYEAYRRKIGNIKVFGLSAKQALKAKIADDAVLLEKSGFPPFEEELERFLSQDRGAVALQIQANKAFSASGELLANLEVRKGALAMNTQEFEEKEAQTREKIAQLRCEREMEFQRIDMAAQKAYLDVLPQISGFWPALEEGALALVEEESFGVEDMRKENVERTKERLLKKIRKHTEDQGRLLSERMQSTLGVALGEEAQRLNDFGNSFHASMDQIRGDFMPAGSGDGKSTTMDMVIGTGVGAIIGSGLLSGAFLGFREGGAKGALVGGAVGLGISLGVGVVGGAMALPLLPLAIIAAGSGAFLSKVTVQRFFGGGSGDAEGFRTQMKSFLREQFRELAEKNNQESAVKIMIQEAFVGMKAAVDRETETILQGMESTLEELKAQIVRQQTISEQEGEAMEKAALQLQQIQQRSSALNKKLAEILRKSAGEMAV